MNKSPKRNRRSPAPAPSGLPSGFAIVGIQARYAGAHSAPVREIGAAVVDVAALEELVETLRAQLGKAKAKAAR